MGKRSKHPKSYYINSAKRKRTNELDVNMSGFLCTCNSREKESVREAYNLLNEFADLLYGKKIKPNAEERKNKEEDKSSEAPPKESEENAPNSDASLDSDSDDIEANLKKEVEALQKSKQKNKDKPHRFQQVSVRVNNCIFISTDLANPVELSVAIMDNILETKKTRTQHLVRMVPVQITCKAFMEDIERTTRELILEQFPKHKLTFYIIFRARNNDSIERDVLLKSLSNIITECNLEAVANYKTPDFVLNVDIVKNICCIGLLPKFLTKYSKYNLLKLVEEESCSRDGNVVNSENKSNIKITGDAEESSSTKSHTADHEDVSEEINKPVADSEDHNDS